MKHVFDLLIHTRRWRVNNTN